ncbi:MAG: hypothetical protein KF850_22420 [Labilithrix sp.]|nr:hypothetical protein [Labilithrix sp.]
MNAPYVGAVVQVRGPRSAAWEAGIVTHVYAIGVDVTVFGRNGGARPLRWVNPLRGDEDAELTEYVWRWAPESVR